MCIYVYYIHVWLWFGYWNIKGIYDTVYTMKEVLKNKDLRTKHLENSDIQLSIWFVLSNTSAFSYSVSIII